MKMSIRACALALCLGAVSCAETDAAKSFLIVTDNMEDPTWSCHRRLTQIVEAVHANGHNVVLATYDGCPSSDYTDRLTESGVTVECLESYQNRSLSNLFANTDFDAVLLTMWFWKQPLPEIYLPEITKLAPSMPVGVIT